MSERDDPFDEIERFFERMNRRFDEAVWGGALGDSPGATSQLRGSEQAGPPGGEPQATPGTGAAATAGATGGTGAMAMDVVERDDEVVVTIDLPGFEREDVDIEVTDRTLYVRAERETGVDDEDAGAAGERYVRRERRHESVRRSIRLPAAVEREGVTARMANGVLTVTLPRSESGDAHRIEIE